MLSSLCYTPPKRVYTTEVESLAAWCCSGACVHPSGCSPPPLGGLAMSTFLIAAVALLFAAPAFAAVEGLPCNPLGVSSSSAASGKIGGVLTSAGGASPGGLSNFRRVPAFMSLAMVGCTRAQPSVFTLPSHMGHDAEHHS